MGLVVKHGHPLDVQSHDFEPTYQPYCGRTPLHLASLKGNAEAMRLLLRLGANPLIKTCHGETPLQQCHNKKKFEEVKKLLKKAEKETKARYKEMQQRVKQSSREEIKRKEKESRSPDRD